MEHLYEQHFGLNKAPFNIAPDPSFLYLSASHREGLAQLTYGIKARKGFVVMTGEVGTGKTTLIHALLQKLSDDTHTAFIFSLIENSADLLRYVCEEFCLTEPLQPRQESHDYLAKLNEFLLASYREGKNCTLIIDEAQNLSAEVLESIRVLSNFETSKDKLLQIVLVGQPELSARLNSPGLRQLKQRVALRYHLRALSLSECQDYIRNRLNLAGGDLSVFAPQALDEIYRYSGGIPRLVNVLCDNAMLTAFALERTTVDGAIIAEVAHDLSLIATIRIASTEPGFANERSSCVPQVETHRRDDSLTASLASGKPGVRLGVSNGTASQLREELPVPEAFWGFMTATLTEAMGPMAKLVIRDQMRLVGRSFRTFPKVNLPVLIEAVASEILDPRMRSEFKNIMAKQMRDLKKG